METTIKSYFDNTAKFSAEFNEMYTKLVPETGSALTLNGELLRAMNNLTYEFHNNANGNTMFAYGRVNPYFGKFVKLLSEVFGERASFVIGIENAIKESDGGSSEIILSESNEISYLEMGDAVMEYVMNNPDSEIPSWYERG